MRVLVIGAAGFVGSHCLRSLLTRGHQPVGFVRQDRIPSRLDDLVDSVQLVQVALVDTATVGSAIQEVAPDAIINAAWYAEPRLYMHDVDRNLQSLKASLTVLEAAVDAGVNRVVLVGSCLEGIGGDSVYARAKRCLHEVAMAPEVRTKASVVCAHVFSLYGPGEDPRRVVPSVIQALLGGVPIAVGPGSARRDYVHVSDVAAGLSVLAETSVTGGIDVCTGRSVRLREMFREIARATGRPELLLWGQATVGSGESYDASGDARVLHGLGWQPQYDLAGGVRETVAWWRSRMATTGGAR